MRGVDKSRQSCLFLDVDRSHQIQTQQGKVGQVILSQFFAAQMCVKAPQAPETFATGAHTFEIGELDTFRVADNDVFDLTFSVYERCDLAIQFVRQFGKLACKLLCNDLARWNSALVELFETPDLVRLQSMQIAVNGTNRKMLLSRVRHYRMRDNIYMILQGALSAIFCLRELAVIASVVAHHLFYKITRISSAVIGANRRDSQTILSLQAKKPAVTCQFLQCRAIERRVNLSSNELGRRGYGEVAWLG
jgi:hypothetical protein